MPTYIVQGRYTRDGIKGLLAKPDDRGPAVAKVIEAAGGKMLGYYVTLGEKDFLIISEAPDEKAVVSAVLVAGASSGVSDLTTTVAMTSAEAKDLFARAGALAANYRPVGG